MESVNDRRGSIGSVVLQAVVLVATGGMLLWKVQSGVLPVYVHERYTALIAATGLVLVAIGLVVAVLGLFGRSRGHVHDHEHDHEGHEHAPLSWRSPAVLAILLPVVLGLTIPARALGTAAIENRGFGRANTLPGQQSGSTEELVSGLPDTPTWDMLDWVNALTYQPDNPRLQGQPIQLTGFVWKRENLASDQFIVSRFVVTCCTADSLALGLPVIWDGTSDLENDTWVRVSGTVGLAEVEGVEEAVILAESVDEIEQPPNPYLTP